MRHFRKRRIIIWAFVDSIIILTAYSGGFFVRAITAPLEYLQSLDFILIAVVITLLSLYLSGVYHRIWSQTSGHDVIVIVYAVAVATLVVTAVDVAAGVILGQRPLPLSVLILGNALTLAGLVTIRYRSRLISGLAWRWRAVWHQEFPSKTTRVLIIGAGESGQTLAWRLKHRWSQYAECSYQIVGFVDDDPDKRGLYVEGCRVLGSRADIPRLVEEHRVGLIVVAIHNISGSDFREILAHCESTSARIKIVPDTFAALNSTCAVPLLRDIEPQDILGRKLVGRHDSVDLEPVTNRVVLVTGAAGSIGSELIRQLLSYAPVKLLLLDNSESGLFNLVTELIPQSRVLTPILADITEKDTLDEIFARYRPQVVFHAAAYKHVPMLELYPREAVRVNIGGTWQLAEMAHKYSVERFVLISTDKAVDPSSVMGASKRACELLMHAFANRDGGKTLFTSVRFGNVLGSNGSVVPVFNRQIDKGGPVTVTHREMTRYFMSIPEAVNLVIHAACLTKGDDLFMLRMGEEIRIVDLAERMVRMHGLRPYEDIEIKFTGARPGEKMHEELQYASEVAIPTAHPGILQLMNQENHFEFDAFFKRLNNLVSSSHFTLNYIENNRKQDTVTDLGSQYVLQIRNCISFDGHHRQ